MSQSTDTQTVARDIRDLVAACNECAWVAGDAGDHDSAELWNELGDQLVADYGIGVGASGVYGIGLFGDEPVTAISHAGQWIAIPEACPDCCRTDCTDRSCFEGQHVDALGELVLGGGRTRVRALRRAVLGARRALRPKPTPAPGLVDGRGVDAPPDEARRQ